MIRVKWIINPCLKRDLACDIKAGGIRDTDLVITSIKPVTSINLLSDDSIEDRVYSTIQRKRELFDAVIEGNGIEFKLDSRQEELRKLVEIIIGKA